MEGGRIALIINMYCFNRIFIKTAYSDSAILINMCMLHSSLFGLVCQKENS